MLTLAQSENAINPTLPLYILNFVYQMTRPFMTLSPLNKYNVPYCINIKTHILKSLKFNEDSDGKCVKGHFKNRKTYIINLLSFLFFLS